MDFSQQAEVYDSKDGAELLDMILRKVIFQQMCKIKFDIFYFLGIEFNFEIVIFPM